MNQKIEVNLSNKLSKELEFVTIEERLSKSELIKKAIADYLYIRKFRKLRKKLFKKAKENSFESDEDILGGNKSFSFLKNEPDLYSDEDIKERNTNDN